MNSLLTVPNDVSGILLRLGVAGLKKTCERLVRAMLLGGFMRSLR